MSPTSAPFIKLQAPVGDVLCSYNRLIPGYEQSETIPRTFCDSMTAREVVFSHEKKAVPIKHHTDIDDARAYHWVIYGQSSSEQESSPQPAGTVRLIPCPHYHAHNYPVPGASYDLPSEDTPFEDSTTFFTVPLPQYVIKKATSLHDGIEPFIKLGRLCVLQEFRGKGYANLLIQAALEFAKSHPECMVSRVQGVPEWKGLVCVHSHMDAVRTWEKNGFVIDDKMGTWKEAGMGCVGMFARLDVPVPIPIRVPTVQ